MNETTQTVTADSEVAAVTEKMLPVVDAEIKDKVALTDEDKVEIERMMGEIDMDDSNSIIFFGTKAQQQLTTVSDNMLEGVRVKDVGPAANSLSDMVATLRGFGAEDLAVNPSWFARWFRGAKPVVKFLQEYEEIRKQIDVVTDKLEGHKTTLLTDIASLDRLYDASLDYFGDLENYIHAGEQKLAQIDSVVIPEMAAIAEQTEDVLKAQELRDIRTARDDLERRVHDLRLTRTVTMQALPSIRLVQENDKGLIRKIQSTVANTVPLWRQQLAQAVTIYRSQQAAGTVKAATDLTNDLLEKNAENLQQANQEVREQIERGVFDLEVVKLANTKLIETINESLQIADEGKKQRAEAVVELEKCERELREALTAASARASAPAATEGA
ncbi:MAG: toxic anion resistance protein [Acidiferrobacterales bacterium]|nr:toxic anion resistance protein [Acidiferrobacterales bacterium]